MLLSKAIVDFLEYLEIDKNRSQKTIQNYDHYLQRLLDFNGDVEVGDINLEIVRKWRLWLSRLGTNTSNEMSAQTINYHLIGLRSFLKYCSKNNIPAMDSAQIELAKYKRRQVTFLSIDEYNRLVSQPDQRSLIGVRDRAIIELLFASGLRVSELVGLNRNDIDFKRREFSIRGKGQKDRLVFVSVSAVNTIRQYLNLRQDNDRALFIRHIKTSDAELNTDIKRLTARSVQRLVAKYALLAGINKKVTPHTMRHTFGTDLLINGADIRSVQIMLGHSNISTTQIYTHITDPHLKKIYEQYHNKES